MDFSNLIFLVMGLTGAIVWTAGYFFARYPPKKINFWYGYRTSTSMRNPEIWTFAQTYAAQEMQNTGKILSAIGLVARIFEIEFSWDIGFALFMTTILPLFMIAKIERVLQQKFPKN